MFSSGFSILSSTPRPIISKAVTSILHVGDTIPAIPFLRPGSKELAEAVVAAMKDHNSILLKKHGQVTCGKDFNQALERAMFFEMAAHIAVVNGSNIDPLTPAEIDSLEEYFLGKKH